MKEAVPLERFGAELWQAAYGLRADPFLIQPGEFIGVPRHREILSSLHQLAHFSSKVLVLSGEAGCGKSAVLRELARGGDAALLPAPLHVETNTGLAELLGVLAATVGVSVNEAEAADLPGVAIRIREACSRRQENGLRTVIILDDADRLPAQELKRFVLYFGVAGQDGMALLLCGLPSFPRILPKLLPEFAEQHRFCHVVLKPLGRFEVRTYLEARLEQAGWSGVPKISPHLVLAITRASGGFPARIEELAPSILLQGRVTQERPVQPPWSRWLGSPVRLSLAAGGLLVLAALFVVWLHAPWVVPADQDAVSDGAEDSGARVTLQLASPLVLDGDLDSELDLNSKAAPVEEPSSTAMEQQGAMAGQDLIGEPDIEPSSRSEVPPIPASEAMPAVAAHASRAESPDGAGPMPAPDIRADTPTSTATSSEAERQETGGTLAVTRSSAAATQRSQQWMNRQPARTWTVQVFGTESLDSAIAYIDGWAVERFEPFWFRSTYRGKPWYIVLLGIYPSRDEARRILQSLPAGIRDQGPWIRPVEGLQSRS